MPKGAMLILSIIGILVVSGLISWFVLNSGGVTSPGGAAAVGGVATPAVTVSGPAVYKEYCADCHGPAGQGSGSVPPLNSSNDLRGSYDLASLTEFIKLNMPNDNPGSLSDSQAAAVAAYVWNHLNRE